MWSNRNSWSFQFTLEPFGFCPFSILRIAFAARESYGHFVSSETSNQCSLNERLKSATGDAIFSYMPFISTSRFLPHSKNFFTSSFGCTILQRTASHSSFDVFDRKHHGKSWSLATLLWSKLVACQKIKLCAYKDICPFTVPGTKLKKIVSCVHNPNLPTNRLCSSLICRQIEIF